MVKVTVALFPLILVIIIFISVSYSYTKNPNDVYAWNWNKNSYAIRYLSEQEEIVTFNDCKGLCTSDGFDMLDIGDDEEFNKINQEMENDGVNTFWTSGTKDSIKDTFYWRTNEQPILSSFWAYREPKKVTGDRICVEYKWDTRTNSHKLFAITPCTGYKTCLCKKASQQSSNNYKSQSFKCTSEGMFPDPYVCNAFHQCVNTGTESTYTDYKMPCGPGTVYCQNLKICGWEHDCPCNDRVIE